MQELSRVEHLSDASFMGKLQVFPANVRLGLKRIVRYKCSSLFGLDNGYKESFITLTTAAIAICLPFLTDKEAK
jgi:hypothetical protein